ncbi:GNAT family N-acetyltransferase [Nonomuraea sp. NPDC005650]|uniref:GNAT family N-acetyltransferase n=1 Tax=Nonomuraea sp. NPDC005650 TaxID=3157045 RepID=UPI0033A70700
MLTGKLVRLRAVEPTDFESIWRWSHDPEVVRWMSSGYPESFMQAQERLTAAPRNSYENCRFIIESLHDQRAVGFVRLRDAKPEVGNAGLDIQLGEKDVWGRGYATEAMRLMCRYGFNEMRLHRITLDFAADNTAARRVYEKVGFVEEGRVRECFRRDGKWHDLILMGLLEGELRDHDSDE